MLHSPATWWKPPVVRAVTSTTRFDVPRLRRSLQILASRHSALRTYFLRDGSVDTAGMLDAEDGQWPLRYVEPSGPASDDAVQQDAFQWLEEEFDPFRPPLVRAILVRQARNDFFGFSVDHAVFDGESLRILLEQLYDTYLRLDQEAHTSDLGSPRSDAAAFAREERSWLGSHQATYARAFWACRMRDTEDYPPLAIPFDQEFTEPALSVYYTVPISSSQLSQIRRNMTEHGLSAFMLVAAATAIALRRLTKVERQSMLFTSARRLWPSSDGLVGYLSNRSLLCLNVPRHSTLAALADQVRVETLEAVRCGMLCHDQFLREQHPESFTRPARVPHLLVNVRQEAPVPSIPDVALAPVRSRLSRQSADVPGLRLNLDFWLDGNATLLSDFPTGLYDPDVIRRLTDDIAKLMITWSRPGGEHS